MDLRRHADLKRGGPLPEAAGAVNGVLGKVPGRVWILLMVLAALGLTMAVYSNTLHAPFMFDDLLNIQENPHIRLESITLQGLEDAAFKGYSFHRPLPKISFALNYYFHGYDLPGYHAVNLLIHLITGLALFLLVKCTIVLARERSVNPGMLEGVDPTHAAFFAMLIWLVHPLATQSVTYVVQRMNSMAAMFYVLSLLCYVKARLAEGRKSWLLFSGSLASGVCAVASKEIAATLPFFIFLYEWYFLQDLDRDWIRRKAKWGAVILGVFIVLAMTFLGPNLLDRIQGTFRFRDFTMWERVLTEFRVVLFYLGQMVLPHPSRLSLTRDFPLSHSLFDPVTTALSLAAIAALLAVSVRYARKERLLSFAVLWYFGNLAIESSVIGLEIIFEHRTYLPSMFLVAVFVAAVFRLARPRWAGIAALCVIAGVFSLWTFQRNVTWGDSVLFHRDALQKHDTMRNRTNLGLVLMDRGSVDEALVHFEKAIAILPDSPGTNRNMAEALMRKKRYEEAYGYYKRALMSAHDDYEDKYRLVPHLGMASALDRLGRHAEAVKEYRLALAVDPRSEKALNLLGRSYAEQGMHAEALEQFRAVLAINPRSGEAHNNAGNVLAQQGRTDEAMKHYREAVRVSPDFADPRYNLANLLLGQGLEVRAIAMYNEALRTDPKHVKTHTALAALFYERGELDKAIGHFQALARLEPGEEGAKKNLDVAARRLEGIRAMKAKTQKELDAEPGNPELIFRMAELNRMEGRFADAVGHYLKVLSIRPGDIRVLRQLAVAYTLSGDYEKAVAALKKIIGLDPDDPEAYYNMACLYSRQGHAEEGVRWLHEAVEHGFRDWDLMKKDRDLSGIRDTSFYRELMKKR